MSAETLPPTQYLVMEVLAARHRLSEPFWPFPQTCRKAVQSLEALGLVRILKDHDVVGAIRVGLTEKGASDWLSDACEPSVPEGPVHLLDSEPTGHRLAVCGAREHSHAGHRLNFTIDPQDASCTACNQWCATCDGPCRDESDEPPSIPADPCPYPRLHLFRKARS